MVDKPTADESQPEDNESLASDPAAPIDEPQTEHAVDDIMRHESDEVIAAEDAKKLTVPDQPWYKKIFSKKKIWIPLVVILVLIIVGGIPLTRYKVLGLFWKKTYTVAVVDSQTKLPVSDASVTLDGKKAATNNQGHATIKAPVGSQKLSISKNYYKGLDSSVFVGLSSKGTHSVQLTATGRQVPLKVVDLISGLPLSNVEVSAAGTSAKTDKTGQVTIVLPADKASTSATLSGSGYNNLKTTIKITASVVPANTLRLTPSGKIYFLSNASGTIDVVSTNLDGTNRQTVLAGTGDENANSTSLLASRDWRYLALQAKRDTSATNNSLYLIDTSTDKLATIDTGNANFTPLGWLGHDFIYQVDRPTVQAWQSNGTSIKSYNADTGQLTTIDSTQATGTQTDYAAQNIQWVNEVGDKVVYFKTWSFYHTYGEGPVQPITGEQATVISALPSGAKTTVKSWNLTDSGNFYFDTPLSSYNEALYGPTEIYFAVTEDNQNTTYDTYENNQVSENSSDAQAFFNNGSSYYTYLLSPSGNQTFWSEPRDGKNTLFVGDANGNSGKQIATLSDYTPYGWYGDNYLLVQKNDSELYIMPVTGGSALQVSDYYKPAQNFNGYGGGYGGQ